mgnify:CR=1 FL=1
MRNCRAISGEYLDRDVAICALALLIVPPNYQVQRRHAGAYDLFEHRARSPAAEHFIVMRLAATNTREFPFGDERHRSAMIDVRAFNQPDEGELLWIRLLP